MIFVFGSIKSFTISLQVMLLEMAAGVLTLVPFGRKEMAKVKMSK